ncbi:transcription initiation factor TFIID subunit 9B isoform X2 [Ammospiza caudacuta]|uniref:transcription initiation factor TFIID subunit 9B isoform X2 n=1 Tax=Ammospiza caudacuta TaxID=2857398 RepID=UPI0027392E67|nr:transcription initiation factor TFIID subunit 9B isoform X2 [Ammospiza caudacuta]
MSLGHRDVTRTWGCDWTQGCDWDTGISLGHGDEEGTRGCHQDTGMCPDTGVSVGHRGVTRTQGCAQTRGCGRVSAVPAGHCPPEEPDAAAADQAVLGPAAAARQVLPDCPQLPPEIPAEEGTPSAQTVSVSAKVGAPVSLAGQRFTVQIPSSQPAGKSATPTTPTVQNVLINPSLIGPKNILITTNMVPPGAADPNPLKRKHEEDDDYDAFSSSCLQDKRKFVSLQIKKRKSPGLFQPAQQPPHAGFCKGNTESFS